MEMSVQHARKICEVTIASGKSRWPREAEAAPVAAMAPEREEVGVQGNPGIQAQYKLTQELEVAYTLDKKAEKSNVFRTHREDEQRLINNCEKVYVTPQMRTTFVRLLCLYAHIFTVPICAIC